MLCLFFFFNDTATTEIYTSSHTLSLHDALPIYSRSLKDPEVATCWPGVRPLRSEEHTSELQSRELISYAVFCLKKKNKKQKPKKLEKEQKAPHRTQIV